MGETYLFLFEYETSADAEGTIVAGLDIVVAVQDTAGPAPIRRGLSDQYQSQSKYGMNMHIDAFTDKTFGRG